MNQKGSVMPSFDVVSEVDMHELANAIDQTSREIGTRYDFKGSSAQVELNDKKVTIIADGDFQIRQIHPMLYQKLTKRGLEAGCLEEGKIETVGKGVRQYLTVQAGIETETAKKIVKKIKASKIKVQAAIQSEQVRVTGKKRDDLQQVMALLRAVEDLGLPLQFKNFRD